MNTLAVISDIHANLPALEAVLADLRQRSDVEGIYHLGDLVGYAPWPNEVVDRLREEGIPGVAGNYDSTVATGYEHCGCRYEDPLQERLSHESYSWTRSNTSEETQAYLGTLPFRMDLRPWGGHLAGPKIILIHGNPVLNTVYWTEDRPDTFCAQMADKAGAREGDILVFGHTHKPWQRTVNGIHFVNAGSVGRPKDCDWRACYLLLHVAEKQEREHVHTGRGPVSAEAEFIRVEYDLAEAQAGIRASRLPNEFAEILETGGSLKS
jgi:predicted phosphodiesterase